MLLPILAFQHPAPADAEQVLVRARRAVASGERSRITREWQAALRHNPADPAARLGLGAIASRAYQFDLARDYLRALAASPARSDPYPLRALLELGRMSLGRDPFDSTRTIMEEVARLAASRGDSLPWAEATAILGFLDSRTVGMAPALERLREAAALVPEGQSWLRALVACYRAPIMGFAGRSGTVREVLAGVEAARASGDPMMRGLCYQSATTVAINASGNPATVHAYADSAAEQQRLAGDRFGLSVTLWIRAYSRIAMYDIAGARQDLRDAMTEAVASRANFSRAWIHRFQGEIFFLARDFVTADREYHVAAAAMNRIGDRFGVAGLLRNRGAIALELGRADQADSIFRQTLAMAEASGMAEGTYASRLALSAVQMVRGNWRAARDMNLEAQAYGKAHGFAGWSGSLLYYLGLASLRLGELDQAEEAFRAAAEATTESQWLDRYAIRSRLAELYTIRGELPRALAEIQAATDQLDSLRAQLDENALRLLVFQTRREYDQPDVGFATIAAGLARGGYHAEVIRLAERRRARVLADQLRRASLLEGSQPSPHLAELTAAPPSLDSLQGLLPPRTAVIEFISGEGGQPTTLVAITGDTTLAQVLPPIDTLASLLTRFSAAVEAGTVPQGLGSRIRRILLDSMLAGLTTIDRLIVLAEGELYHLPLDVLPLDSGEPLLSRFGVSRVPSLVVLAALHSRPPRGLGTRVLALGDPELPDSSAASEDWPELPGSRAEARQVIRFGRDGVVLTGRRASEAWLKRMPLEEFTVLHLAAHAEVDENSVSRTRVLLAGGEGEDGVMTTGEVAALRIPADLVVLSACRTARGVAVGGEGIQGLSSAFFEAGARSVVATRWSVADRGAADFVARFYRRLAEGASVDVALRLAKLDSHRAGISPAVWGAFVALGPPDVRITLQAPGRYRWDLGLMVLLAGTLLGWFAFARVRGRQPAA